MKKVIRSEVVAFKTYETGRDAFRTRIMKIKDERRVQIKPYLTFLFENHDTMLYQIQEMVRTERMSQAVSRSFAIVGGGFSGLSAAANEASCPRPLSGESRGPGAAALSASGGGRPVR